MVVPLLSVTQQYHYQVWHGSTTTKCDMVVMLPSVTWQYHYQVWHGSTTTKCDMAVPLPSVTWRYHYQVLHGGTATKFYIAVLLPSFTCPHYYNCVCVQVSVARRLHLSLYSVIMGNVHSGQVAIKWTATSIPSDRLTKQLLLRVVGCDVTEWKRCENIT